MRQGSGPTSVDIAPGGSIRQLTLPRLPEAGADEGAAGLDRVQTGVEFGMEQVPDMDHLGPDLQIDPHIGGAGQPRQPDRVVEQRLAAPTWINRGARPARSA